MKRFFPFNINQYVKVRLTDHGRKILRDNYEGLKAYCGGSLRFEYRPPDEDKSGWSKWQAWRLMEEFGPHIGVSSKHPFDLNILIEASDS